MGDKVENYIKVLKVDGFINMASVVVDAIVFIVAIVFWFIYRGKREDSDNLFAAGYHVWSMTAIFWTTLIYLLAVSIPRVALAIYLLAAKFDPRTAFTAVSVRIGTTVIQIVASLIVIISLIIQLADYEKSSSSSSVSGYDDYKFYNYTAPLILVIVYGVLTSVYVLYNVAMSVVALLWHKEVKE